jgi:uracil-DNA glycosylase family protein
VTRRPTAAPFVPATRDVDELAEAAQSCTGCALYRDATQTVFGSGPSDAAILLVGEQPGDVEDKKGRVFVGPAGAVLWSCLEDASIGHDEVFATNAVKHFKHEVRGKRRLHKKPAVAEIEACHPWLDAEIAAVRPRVIVALGAVAARALTGRTIGIEASRGRTMDRDGIPLVVTYHPSAVLRAEERAREIRAALVADLRAVRRMAGLRARRPRRRAAVG